jgi:hypothetical protein
VEKTFSKGSSPLAWIWEIASVRTALKLVGPRGRVLEVLTLFRLLEMIPSVEDETQSLASFRPKRRSNVVSLDALSIHKSW